MFLLCMHFTFTALDHVNEILKKMNKRCVLVWSGASLFVGGEDYVRRGSFCNKMTSFATIHVTAWLQQKAPGV